MFEKNKSGNPKGRPTGAKGKAPMALKEVIEGIIAEVFTQEQITLDLLKCEPRERLSLLIKLIEFCLPKLKSVEAKGNFSTDIVVIPPMQIIVSNQETKELIEQL